MELPSTSVAGPEGDDRAVVAVDSVSPSPNNQFMSGSIAPPVSEIASTLASLRTVCLKNYFYGLAPFSFLYLSYLTYLFRQLICLFSPKVGFKQLVSYLLIKPLVVVFLYILNLFQSNVIVD